MSEFIVAMGDVSGSRQTTDHNFKRVLAGDADDVRERLVYALERLGYRVLSEQPLMAKRQGGVNSCSFDVLKCVKSLTIGLKALNPTSTLVTFDYEILNSFVTKGDRSTIEREAEAIIALATTRPESPVCAYCGTANSDDSRFCRACGRPSMLGEPAEVEVFRLTAGARPAYQTITTGLILAFIVAAVAIPLIFLSSKGPKAGLVLLAIGELTALCSLLYGMWRLHTTLNPRADASKQASADTPSSKRKLPAAQGAALPPARYSVTEGTTELLTPQPERERVPVGAKREKIDTAEIR